MPLWWIGTTTGLILRKPVEKQGEDNVPIQFPKALTWHGNLGPNQVSKHAHCLDYCPLVTLHIMLLISRVRNASLSALLMYDNADG